MMHSFKQTQRTSSDDFEMGNLQHTNAFKVQDMQLDFVHLFFPFDFFSPVGGKDLSAVSKILDDVELVQLREGQKHES